MPVNDPKQIVTPYAFEVAPDLLGEPLATPRRRMAAIFIDLCIAGLLSVLGALILAAAVSAFFFMLALRKKYEEWYKNILKYAYASTASFFVFVLALALIEGTSNDEESGEQISNVVTASQLAGSPEWSAFSEKAMSISKNDTGDAAEKWQKLAKELEDNLSRSVGVISADNLDVKPLPENAPDIIRSYAAGIETGDSVLVDSLEAIVAGMAARKEIARLEYLRNEDRDALRELTERNEELAERAENPGIYTILKQLAEDTGLALGWVGLYFIISLAWWEGQTPGKKLMKLKVVRLNGKPLYLWYSFERFGGYAAGLATGLLGFFQVFWDANRQGIHDKIAGTVVLDLRESKRDKTAAFRQETLERENLLS